MRNLLMPLISSTQTITPSSRSTTATAGFDQSLLQKKNPNLTKSYSSSQIRRKLDLLLLLLIGTYMENRKQVRVADYSLEKTDREKALWEQFRLENRATLLDVICVQSRCFGKEEISYSMFATS